MRQSSFHLESGRLHVPLKTTNKTWRTLKNHHHHLHPHLPKSLSASHASPAAPPSTPHLRQAPSSAQSTSKGHHPLRLASHRGSSSSSSSVTSTDDAPSSKLMDSCRAFYASCLAMLGASSHPSSRSVRSAKAVSNVHGNKSSSGPSAIVKRLSRSKRAVAAKRRPCR